MNYAVYYYLNNRAIQKDYFTLRQEITITHYPYYYEDFRRLNLELVGDYPLWF